MVNVRRGSEASNENRISPDGSSDYLLVRIYNFKPDEVLALHLVFVSLSTGILEEVLLEELPGIELVSGCQVRLKVGSWDRGSHFLNGSAWIKWQLTRERRDNVAGLTEPFCNQLVNG